jgi:hypothetical protein
LRLETLKLRFPIGIKATITEDFQVDRLKLEEMGTRKIRTETVFGERVDFFDLEGRKVLRGGKSPKVNVSCPTTRYACVTYVIECQEVVRDPETGEPIELKCVYYRIACGRHARYGSRQRYHSLGRERRRPSSAPM